MIRGVGIDLVELKRMKAAYDRHQARLAHRICTPAEIELTRRDRQPFRKLAVMFGIKEAVMKALGTGMRGVGWKEIETSAPWEGPVDRLLSGRALAVARTKGVTRYSLSVTMSSEIVLTTVLLSEELTARHGKGD